MSNILWFC